MVESGRAGRSLSGARGAGVCICGSARVGGSAVGSATRCSRGWFCGGAAACASLAAGKFERQRGTNGYQQGLHPPRFFTLHLHSRLPFVVVELLKGRFTAPPSDWFGSRRDAIARPAVSCGFSMDGQNGAVDF